MPCLGECTKHPLVSMLLSGAGQCEDQSEMQALDMMFSNALLSCVLTDLMAQYRLMFARLGVLFVQEERLQPLRLDVRSGEGGAMTIRYERVQVVTASATWLFDHKTFKFKGRAVEGMKANKYKKYHGKKDTSLSAETVESNNVHLEYRAQCQYDLFDRRF
ncbi:uncharacterized protein FMAN_14984 [Fusarium mangiferae]|uniref:Uncharacterized protein n=1 Tax=Fusarium mangiferae TaxID=192010 RepID=A0A1L7U7V5_FUSMA|nr:uncharacterized protein FMAN_14984 [Fusarium mangiferae]CVL03807.1 uncharacterized protein FMAN_14984 [Fusarium mangiferae]